MSTPSIASSSTSQHPSLHHSSETEYTSNLPYKSISAFLNQHLTLAGKSHNQTAHFSLAEMLSHMNIKEVVLKGSAVHQFKSKTPPDDIDLQCHLDAPNIQLTLADKLADFLNKHSASPSTTRGDLLRKTWFSKIAYEAQDTWSRLILSTGYLKPQRTKIDLSYSSKPHSVYDMLGASKTIRINLEKKQANIIDKWTPSLVNWMRKNHFLWFKHDIDNGLGRLSYRINKTPNAYLLQPQIPAVFCQTSSAESIQNIYMRILRDEYSNAYLSVSERACLWEPVVDTVANLPPFDSQNTLSNDLKTWSKFNELDRLKAALQSSDSQEVVLNRLTSACKIGLNFKEGLSKLLLDHADVFRTQLQPLVSKALGVHIAPAETLFNMLNTLNNIQDIPKSELHTVFSDCLQHYSETGDDNTLTQAENMCGWLNGDMLSSALFWLDRVPNNVRSSPSDGLTHPIMRSCLDLIESQNVTDSLEPILPQLSQIRIKEEHWMTLCNALFKSETFDVSIGKNTPEAMCLSFIQMLSRHANILTNDSFHLPPQETSIKMPIDAMYKDILKFCGRLKPQSIPPFLTSIVSIRNQQAHIQLPNMQLEVTQTPPKVTLITGKMKKFITNHLYGVLGPSLSSPKDELNILWKDGCLFSGTAHPNTRDEQFYGIFSSPINHPMPSGLNGLIGVARALCSTKYPDFYYDDHQITAKGMFFGNGLLKASDIQEALKCVNIGEIHDTSTLNDKFRLYHKIMNGYPTGCGLTIEEDEHFTLNLQLVYEKQQHALAITEFKNAWSLPIAEHQLVHETTSASEGRVLFKMPWNAKTRSFDGNGEVQGTSNKQPFKWKGKVRAGKPLMKGTLYIGSNNRPTLVLDSKEENSTLPIPLITMLASWFTGYLNGTYPFASNIWSQRSVWPPSNFEGFISKYEKDGHQFTGYKTANGKAIGVWTNNLDCAKLNDNDTSANYSLYVGSFLTRKQSETPEALSPLIPISQTSEIPLDDHMVLIPHGLLQQNIVNKETYSVTHTIQWLYFQGAGVSYTHIDQHENIRHDTPNLTRHFHGAGYNDAGKAKSIDMVFNPEDGGADFVLIRPENFFQEKNYQTIYQDIYGTTQKILVMNNEYSMGEITCPSGIRYAGQIKKEGKSIELRGQFKLSIEGFKFQGVLDSDLNAHIAHIAHIAHLKALTPESQTMLNSVQRMYGVEQLTLRGLISFVSGGLKSYESDLQPHLRIRGFTDTAANARVTEFSLNK